MALLSALLQFNKVSVNGRLQRWPSFAKGSLSGPRMEVTVVLAYEDPLPRLSVRRHNSWRSACEASFRKTAPPGFALLCVEAPRWN